MLERITDPDDRTMVARHIHEELGSGEVLSIDFRITTRSGEERWISHICQPVYDADGNWLGRRGSDRDITGCKRAEERAQRFLDQQIAVNRLALALGESKDLNKMYCTVYDHVRALMDAEVFIVSFYDNEAQLIQVGYVVSRGIVRDVTNYPPIPLEKVGHDTQNRVIRTGEPYYAPDWRKAMQRTMTEYLISENGTVSEGPPPPEGQENS
jgi:hypothetical protein